MGNPDSYVYALDATTGEFRWRFGKGGQASGAVGAGLLTVAQGILFAVGATRLYALDPSSGKVQDTYPPTLPCANGVAYIGSADGSLEARDLIKSKVLWTRRVKNAQWSPGTIAGSVLYLMIYNTTRPYDVSTNWASAIMALDSATGKNIWTYAIPEESYYATPVVSAGIVYVVGDWNLYALDAVTGKPHWIYTSTTGLTIENVAVSSS